MLDITEAMLTEVLERLKSKGIESTLENIEKEYKELQKELNERNKK